MQACWLCGEIDPQNTHETTIHVWHALHFCFPHRQGVRHFGHGIACCCASALTARWQYLQITASPSSGAPHDKHRAFAMRRERITRASDRHVLSGDSAARARRRRGSSASVPRAICVYTARLPCCRKLCSFLRAIRKSESAAPSARPGRRAILDACTAASILVPDAKTRTRRRTPLSRRSRRCADASFRSSRVLSRTGAAMRR